MAKYYYFKGANKIEATVAELREKILSGEITRDTIVEVNGQRGPAGRVRGLFDTQSPSPSPASSPSPAGSQTNIPVPEPMPSAVPFSAAQNGQAGGPPGGNFGGGYPGQQMQVPDLNLMNSQYYFPPKNIVFAHYRAISAIHIILICALAFLMICLGIVFFSIFAGIASGNSGIAPERAGIVATVLFGIWLGIGAILSVLEQGFFMMLEAVIRIEFYNRINLHR